MHLTQITLENLQKNFSQGAITINVLQNINAQFQQGLSYAITGASGSGKSTLLHLLAGIDSPTAGSVFFNGKNLGDISSKEREKILHKTIGLVFQLPYLIAELSVIENVILKGLIDGLDVKVCRSQGIELLNAVGIAEKADTMPASLSGGQQQRAAIARAMFNRPAFLVADEPTGNLDEETGRNIIDLLLFCQTEWKMGLIVSTHNKDVAGKMDICFELKDGTIFER